ncbi:MAG: ABC transporter ATP-binding protein [Nonlabens sp.]
MLELVGIDFNFTVESTLGHDLDTSSGILNNISLQLSQGQHLALLGESGCGKSTLLNYIYGLLPYSSGKVLWNGRSLTGAQDHLIPGHSMMNYVPQEFDLMPFTTVAENVGTHLSIQLDDRLDKIRELLEVVDLKGFENRKVKSLSGGQKQRVAIAKSLAQQPQLLLMDEPFSHIDHFRRSDLRRKIFTYLKKENISSIIATHDSDDALSFTNQIMIMRNGSIEDYRPTLDVYRSPLNIYCASLFDEASTICAEQSKSGKTQNVYPHQLRIEKEGLPAIVLASYFKGSHYMILAQLADHTTVFFNNPGLIKEGTPVFLAVIP